VGVDGVASSQEVVQQPAPGQALMQAGGSILQTLGICHLQKQSHDDHGNEMNTYLPSAKVNQTAWQRLPWCHP
jgi:hypothetical protein